MNLPIAHNLHKLLPNDRHPAIDTGTGRVVLSKCCKVVKNLKFGAPTSMTEFER